jgi:NAD(P)H-flavin reductase
MLGREFKCVVIEKTWLTRTVALLRFKPSKPIRFEPGQFVSVRVPDLSVPTGAVRRAYSIASSADSNDVLELCIQQVEGGIGSQFMTHLKPGDTFLAAAPFGDFFFDTSPERNACFICTGTGIAPFRSMILSPEFQTNGPQRSLLVLGVRTEQDLLFPGELERHGVQVVPALSQPSQQWTGFRGRVTDYLASLPQGWVWKSSDFYLCGNGAMVNEVREQLLRHRRVSHTQIKQEVYFTPIDRKMRKIA